MIHYRTRRRIRPMSSVLLLLLCASAQGVACSPELSSGVFRCDPHTANPCPKDYYCQIRGSLPEYYCYPGGGGFCGDGRRNPDELCEGADLGGRTCRDYDRWRGALRCTDRCQIDSTECVGLRSLSLSAGRTCAVDETGQAWCWGSDDGGWPGGLAVREPVSPEGEQQFASVAVAMGSTCGLDPDGTAWCWGNDYYLGVGGVGGVYDTPIPVWGEHRFSRLVSGRAYYCGLDSTGAVWCWGWLPTSHEKVGVPTRLAEGHTFREIGLSGYFICALDDEDQAWCWGANGLGSLGTGTGEDATEPAPVAGGRRYQQLAIGLVHGCGLDVDGRAWCWGLRLGPEWPEQFSDQHIVLAPRLEGGGHHFTQLRAGGDLTCGLDEEGAVWCWYGHEESPRRALLNVPVLEVLVDSLGATVCGITASGDVRCQGWNGDGALQPKLGLDTPYLVSLPRGALTILTIGQSMSCGLDVVGSAWCWGTGKLGDGVDYGVPQPYALRVAVLPSELRSISAGENSACALDGSGRTWCWGSAEFGLIGPASSRSEPVLLPGAPTLESLTLSSDHACGLDGSGQAWCWGDNTYGQLGNGTTVATSTPTRVSDAPVFKNLLAGWEMNHALGIDGQAYCFGFCIITEDNGDSRLQYRPTPVPTPVPSDVVFWELAAAGTGACGLDELTGHAWCWGDGRWGTLGSGDTFDSIWPQQVAGDHAFISIRGGGQHVCALDSEGIAYCWGANDVGQAGAGFEHGDRVLTPTAVNTSARFGALYLGHRTSCGISLDGQAVYCWGDNTYGQAAYDGYLNEPVPLVGPDDTP